MALIACLSLGACREQHEEHSVSDPKATPSEVTSSAGHSPAQEEPTSSEAPVSLQQEIADLQRSIKTREQTVEDLDAVVAMERDKVDDNPDYESPILQETLHEQEQERLEIEKAQIQLKTLTR